MARVETVVSNANAQTNAQPNFTGMVLLRPGEILVGETTLHARPGPASDDEQKSIEALAKDLREIGQIVPITVETIDGGYLLIDGARRVRAAALIDTDAQPFKLVCAIREGTTDSLCAAIRANTKRRGYTALQFALLCAQVQRDHNWKGTTEVAEYVGVSRAQVSQHLKLLTKPPAMAEKVYRDLLSKVNTYGISTEAALHVLAHVEPDKAGDVIEKAQSIADQEALQGIKNTPDDPTTGTPPVEISPERANEQPEASKPAGKTVKLPKLTASQQKRQKEVFAEQNRKHKERVAAEKAAAKAKAAGPAKIQPKHVRQAVKETGAAPAGRKLQKTLPELRKLFDVLAGTAYPDVMRAFISLLADAWWRGDATDREVTSAWSKIAQIVEAHQELHQGSHQGSHQKSKPAPKVKPVPKAKSNPKGKSK